MKPSNPRWLQFRTWEVMEQMQRERENGTLEGLSADNSPAGSNTSGSPADLPPELLRVVCTHLHHVDIEQARRSCKAWAAAFGRAVVADMYLAMCTEEPGHKMLLASDFSSAFPDWHRLHLWGIPGRPKTKKGYRPEGDTFRDYMTMFASLTPSSHKAQGPTGGQARHHPIRALTLHYLNDIACPLPAITQLKQLTKLELVDFSPRNTSLAPLAEIPGLKQLIIDYKDGTTAIDLASINQVRSLDSLELSLGSMFAKELMSHTCPHKMQQLCSELHQVLGPSLSQYITSQAQRAAASQEQRTQCISDHTCSAMYAAVSLLLRITSGAALAVDAPLTLSLSTALAMFAAGTGFTGFARLQAAGQELNGGGRRPLATDWLAHTGSNAGAPLQQEHSSSSSSGRSTSNEQEAWEALITCSSRSATDGAAKQPTLAKVLLHGLGVVWRDLRLRRLSLRNAPADWGAAPSTFLSVLPSLAVLNLTGLDTRLDESYSSLSFPSFKVEVVRNSACNLSLAVHAEGQEELSSVMACLSAAFGKKRSSTQGSGSGNASPPHGQRVHNKSEPSIRGSSHTFLSRQPSTSCQEGHTPHAARQQRQSQQQQQQQQQQQGQPSARPETCTAASWTSTPRTDVRQLAPTQAQQPRLSVPHALAAQGPQDLTRASSSRPKLTALRFFLRLRMSENGFQPLRRLREVQTSSLRELAFHVVYNSKGQDEESEGISTDEQATVTGKHRSHSTKKLMAKLGHRHIISALLSSSALRGLRSLSVSEELDTQGTDSDEEGQEAPNSHNQCSLCPTGIQLLSRLNLTSLHYHGLLAAPHPSTFSMLSTLTRLKTLSLGSNDEDSYLPSMGMHCLPSGLTALTLQNMNIGGAPFGHSVQLPNLSHICFKRCRLPSLPALAPATSLEWINFDNCEMGSMYLSDFIHLLPKLSWLEITYVHDDWRLLNHPSDLAALQQMTCLRKLSLITPYESNLKIKELLQLSSLRLLSLSPGPSASSYAQLLSLSNFRYLAGLEIKLYSDIIHHTDLITTSDTDGSYAAQELHVDLQEALPMTDVLVMVDDEAVDDWGEAGEEHDGEVDESYNGSSDSSENEESSGEEWSTENEGTV